MIAQRPPARAAGHGAFQHHVQRALAAADGPHGVMDAPAAKPGLRHLEAAANLAQQVIQRHANLVIMDMRMVTVFGIERPAATHRLIYDTDRSWPDYEPRQNLLVQNAG